MTRLFCVCHRNHYSRRVAEEIQAISISLSVSISVGTSIPSGIDLISALKPKTSSTRASHFPIATTSLNSEQCLLRVAPSFLLNGHRLRGNCPHAAYSFHLPFRISFLFFQSSFACHLLERRFGRPREPWCADFVCFLFQSLFYIILSSDWAFFAEKPSTPAWRLII